MNAKKVSTSALTERCHDRVFVTPDTTLPRDGVPTAHRHRQLPTRFLRSPAGLRNHHHLVPYGDSAHTRRRPIICRDGKGDRVIA
jgi:hypothetical protein